VSFTCHWGQEYGMDAATVRTYFGDRIERWKQTLCCHGSHWTAQPRAARPNLRTRAQARVRNVSDALGRSVHHQPCAPAPTRTGAQSPVTSLSVLSTATVTEAQWVALPCQPYSVIARESSFWHAVRRFITSSFRRCLSTFFNALAASRCARCRLRRKGPRHARNRSSRKTVRGTAAR
jgi:hypothetical protein